MTCLSESLSSFITRLAPVKPVLVLSLALTGLAGADCRPRYVQEELPGFFDKDMGGFFLDYAAVVKEEKLTWLQAAEWQNGMRDCLLARTKNYHRHFEYLDDCYREGRERINNPESGYKMPDFKTGEFVVAFDLDETLLSQWFSRGEKGEFSFKTSVRDWYIRGDEIVYGPRYVSLIPGWLQAMQRLLEIPNCRGVVLFTAKDDSATADLVANWNYTAADGQKKNIRRLVSGVFTRNYLVRNHRVLKPSKDLRILDPELKHAVIVDDNPTRLFQTGNVRVFPVYSADLYIENKAAINDITTYYNSLLDLVVDEISEAAVYARLNGVDFSKAFFPYSQRGRPFLSDLESILKNRARALQLLRSRKALYHPQYHDKGSQKLNELP